MKFGRLMEYSMRKIFHEKSYTKCGGEAVPDPFIKNLKYIKTKVLTTCSYLK